MKKIVRYLLGSLSRFIKYLYLKTLNIKYANRPKAEFEIPVIINNFNRLSFPTKLIGFLEKCGLKNIILLDNNSTYPPLLKYYSECRYKVIRLKENHGHLALWRSGLYHRYKWDYFIYTDPDVLPIDECPKDFISHMKKLLDNNYSLDKVGFGIKIDDLPNEFELKEKVIQYESRYWMKEISPDLFDAPIDTTFALYKPFSSPVAGHIFTLPAGRMKYPYLLRHLPWYIDSKSLSEEELHYRSTANNSSTLTKQAKGRETIY